MLVYLKYSLISTEQLKSKLWEVPAVIDIPLGIWSAWKGRSQPDFAEWAFICVQAKTAAEGNQNMQVQIGCEWGWDRGKKSHFGVLISLPGVPAGWYLLPKERQERCQAAWPPLLSCLSLAQGTAVWGCVLWVQGTHNSFFVLASWAGQEFGCIASPGFAQSAFGGWQLVLSLLTCSHICQTIQNTFESGTAWVWGLP